MVLEKPYWQVRLLTMTKGSVVIVAIKLVNVSAIMKTL